MAVHFNGRAEDEILGTVYVTAIDIQDKVALCSGCGKRGVTILADLRCTRTARVISTTVCEQCKPNFSRSLFNWYLNGTATLKEEIANAYRN